MIKDIFLFALVIILTAVNNWIIPVAIYASKFGLFKKRPPGFVGCNFWGFIMDVILAGLINSVILSYLLSISVSLTQQDILTALFLGFIFMVVTHIYMAVTFWKEWIMPSPWRWNAGGYWHMISMSLQIAYCFYPLVLFSRYPKLLALSATKMTIILVMVLGILFLLSLSHKNKDLKIGPLTISAKVW